VDQIYLRISVVKISILLSFLALTGCSPSANRSSNTSIRQSQNEPPASQAAPGKQTNKKWTRAVFKGLTMGIDLRDKSIKILGKPTSSGDPQETDQDKKDPVIVDEYQDFDETYKNLLITSSRKTGTLYNIVAIPNDSSIEFVTGLFGSDYSRARYKLFECPGDSTTSNIIESLDGDLEYIEYREKGISISLNHNKVEEILFVSRPVGLESARCP
jgi:hypothetical protein